MVRYYAIVVLLLGSGGVGADALSVSELMEQVRVSRDSVTLYNEQRMSDKLREPLQLSGELRFTAGGDLVKTVTNPFVETVTVTADELVLSRKGKTRRLAMQRNQGLYGFFQGLKAVLDGDVATMQAMFDMQLESDDSGWTLTCVPLDAAMQSYLQYMRLSGSPGRIDQIFVQQQDRWQQIDLPVDDER